MEVDAGNKFNLDFSIKFKDQDEKFNKYYSDILTILRDNKFPFKTGDTFVDFTNQNANFTAIVLLVLAPLFHIASVLKHLLVKRKT